MAIKAAAPVGTFIGQVVFGYLADHIGRKRMCKRGFPDPIPLSSSLRRFCNFESSWRSRLGFDARDRDTHDVVPTDGIELIIIIIGTFGQTISAQASIGTISIYSVLFVWRLIVSSVLAAAEQKGRLK